MRPAPIDKPFGTLTPYILGSSGLQQKRKNFHTRIHIWSIDWGLFRLDLGWTLEILTLLVFFVGGKCDFSVFRVPTQKFAENTKNQLNILKTIVFILNRKNCSQMLGLGLCSRLLSLLFKTCPSNIGQPRFSFSELFDCRKSRSRIFNQKQYVEFFP